MVAKNISDLISLNNGVQMPQIGLGVWRTLDGDEVRNAIKWAFEAGYRSIDTASLYENETGVGQAVRDSGISRQEIFVTTKVWNNQQGYDATLKAFESSLKRLNMDYVDLYLEHFPVTGQFKETWRAMEKLYDEKLIRAIGVSNFHPHHLDALLAVANVLPVVNQVELHPYLTQKGVLNYCNEKGIAVEAWAPIAKGRVLSEKIITDLAAKYQKTPAQIVLRWELQQGIIVIPKSTHQDRITENADVFDFFITDHEIRLIDSLERNGRIGTDPDLMQY